MFGPTTGSLPNPLATLPLSDLASRADTSTAARLGCRLTILIFLTLSIQ